VDPELSQAIMSCYKGCKAYLKTLIGNTDVFPILRGVRQGDVLSPLLFNIAMNPIYNHIRKKFTGYQFNDSINVNILAFVDDIALVAKSREELSEMINELDKFCIYSGMEINTKKTELISNVHEGVLSIPLLRRELLAKKCPCPKASQTLLSEAVINNPNPTTSAVKYLGVWMTAKLDWTKAIECACRSFKSKITRIQNKKVPVSIKVEVMNTIINKSLEYTLGFTAISDNKLKTLSDHVAKYFKTIMKMNGTVPSSQLYASISKEGLGINHVSLVHDTAIIANAMRAYFQCNDKPCLNTSLI